MSAAPDPQRPRTGAGVPGASARASEYLRSLQNRYGWWKGELETNVTMDAEDLLLRHILGIRTDTETERAALWIRGQQRADGTWANFAGGPANLSTTVEAYVALRLAGDGVDAPHMSKAAHFIREEGGLEASRVFTRIWLAMVGQWSWDELPALPPELVYLPSWVPLNIYDFACWARQTIVPLTIVGSLRPVHPLPFNLIELRTGRRTARKAPLVSWARGFELLDKGLHAYGRRPVRRVRRAAMARAAEWIIRRQESDGCWGGIQPPWVYSLIALRELGYSLSHPVLARGIAGIDRFVVDDENGRRLEACQSPIWDTALAVIALSDAGVPADDPIMVSAGQWLLDEEVTTRGDWAVRRPELEAGGWPFEFHNDGYPDIDDTAEVVMALRRVQPSRDVQDAIDRGTAWSTGMQSSDGGWAAFDADNTRELAYQIPFADFGAMIDPPTADVTAHMVEMLAQEGRAGSPEAQRGVQWLLNNQERDGSWFGRWGANYLYGTGAVLPALVAVGLGQSHPAIRRAVRWLRQVQNADGGWGEDLRSYDAPSEWSGHGDSTASQTAWAMIALLAAGDESDAVHRGARWLAEAQRADGGWDEPQFTGTGFPGDFYINYHLYRIVFPVMALGRYLQAHPQPAMLKSEAAS
ncbi:MAG TPA: squalene--hopene cyclase [Mycobacteriales bacterium]|nr:squalene--hopene cyclase [Mycobacteriales bacterium]